MTYLRAFLAVILGSTFLTGCVSTTPTVKTEKAYVIYNITGSNLTHKAMSDAIVNGFKKRADQVTVQNDIPPHPLPETPGRFEMVKPQLTGNLAALAGNLPSRPECKNQILTVNTYDKFAAGESTTFFACLLPYQGGYHLDIYTEFKIKEGGFSAEMMGATLARTVVGNSGQFIPDTLNTIQANLKEIGATVEVVESYP